MRDGFCIEGGCWCPNEMTLQQLRLGGHTQECIQARRGWEANMRHLSALERERREYAAIGEAVVKAGAPNAY